MRRTFALVLLLACGCAEKPPPASPDTGAKDAAAAFFGGLIVGEPQRAYDLLDPESQRRVTPERFAQLAAAYSRNVGFTAEKVHFQTCEEQGDSATARVVLIGRAPGHSRRYADGITLRRIDGRWRVVLPANFGHRTRP